MLWILLLEIDVASLIDPSTHVALFSHHFDGPSVFSSSETIGSKKGGEIQSWTKDECLRFNEAVMDKSLSFYAFLRGGKAFCERSENTEELDGGLANEVRLAAPYGELNESLQQRTELVMRFFLALGGPVDALSIDKSMKSSMAVPETLDVDTDGDTSIFDMGRG